MGGLRMTSHLINDHKMCTGADPESFGGGDVILNVN